MKTRFSGSFSLIPVKTGIQRIQEVLDSRLRGSDGGGDFLLGFHPEKTSFHLFLFAEVTDKNIGVWSR